MATMQSSSARKRSRSHFSGQGHAPFPGAICRQGMFMKVSMTRSCRAGRCQFGCPRMHVVPCSCRGNSCSPEPVALIVARGDQRVCFPGEVSASSVIIGSPPVGDHLVAHDGVKPLQKARHWLHPMYSSVDPPQRPGIDDCLPCRVHDFNRLALYSAVMPCPGARYRVNGDPTL